MSRETGWISAGDTRLYAVDAPGGTPALLSSAAASVPCRTGAASSAVSAGSTARCASTRGRAGSRADRPTTPYRRQSRTSDGSSTRPTSNARSSSGGSGRHDRGAIRGSELRTGRGRAHRRRLPDRHVDEAGREGPRPVPSVGVDDAHPGGARRSTDAAADPRTSSSRWTPSRRARDRSAALECPTCSSSARATRAPRGEKRVRLPPPTPRRGASACPYSQRRQAHRILAACPTPWSPR